MSWAGWVRTGGLNFLSAFVIGRGAFWAGYLLHPMGRAFGMVLTVLPTLASYGWLAWQLK